MDAEFFLVGFYAIWFVLSVVRQARMPLHGVFARWDYGQLVPDWSLFAGPAHPDYMLILRVVRPDGVMSGWEPVEVWTPKPFGAFLWHPQLTPRLIAERTVDAMLRARGSAARSRLQRSLRYRSFLRFLLKSALERNAVALQFIVYAYRRYDPAQRPEVVFLSDIHDFHEYFHDAV